MLEHSWKLGFYETNIWSPWFIDLYDYMCVRMYVCVCIKKNRLLWTQSVPDIGAAVLIINTISYEYTLRIALVVVPPKILFVIAINIPCKCP